MELEPVKLNRRAAVTALTPYLSSALLVLDAASSKLSVQALPDVVAAIVRKGSFN